MDYDPTKQALFHPESRDPTPGFGPGWPMDLICAELSRLAYYRYEDDGGARLSAALRTAGFSDPRLFISPRGDAQGFGTTADGVAYVVFRGTQPDSVSDLLADVRFGLRPWPGGGRVHQGFRDAFESLHSAIKDWLEGAGDRRLVVAGHSLGAAMATIMAGSYPAATLVTFGSPRVGDAAFVAGFAGRDVRRFVGCADLVTRVPPELLGYSHLPDMRYIDRGGAVRATPPSKPEIDADRATARRDYLHCAIDVWHNVPARDLADHAPINYVGALLGGRTGP
jgi:pimeloyl-ACP methyl ester carboxylesterase